MALRVDRENKYEQASEEKNIAAGLTRLQKAVADNLILESQAQEEAKRIFERIQAAVDKKEIASARLMALFILKAHHKKLPPDVSSDQETCVTLFCRYLPSISREFNAGFVIRFIEKYLIIDSPSRNSLLDGILLAQLAEYVISVEPSPTIQCLLGMLLISLPPPHGNGEQGCILLEQSAKTGVLIAQFLYMSTLLIGSCEDLLLESANQKPSSPGPKDKIFLSFSAQPSDTFYPIKQACWLPREECRKDNITLDDAIDMRNLFLLLPQEAREALLAEEDENVAAKQNTSLFLAGMRQLNTNPLKAFQLIEEAAFGGQIHALNILVYLIQKGQDNFREEKDATPPFLSKKMNQAAAVFHEHKEVKAHVLKTYEAPSLKLVRKIKQVTNPTTAAILAKLHGVLLMASRSIIPIDETDFRKKMELFMLMTINNAIAKLTLADFMIEGYFKSDSLYTYNLIKETASLGNAEAREVLSELQQRVSGTGSTVSAMSTAVAARVEYLSSQAEVVAKIKEDYKPEDKPKEPVQETVVTSTTAPTTTSPVKKEQASVNTTTTPSTSSSSTPRVTPVSLMNQSQPKQAPFKQRNCCCFL